MVQTEVRNLEMIVCSCSRINHLIYNNCDLFLTGVHYEQTNIIQAMWNLVLQGQYAFIHDALLEAAICGETEIHVKELPAKINELEQFNPETNRSYLQEEFEVIISLVS